MEQNTDQVIFKGMRRFRYRRDDLLLNDALRSPYYWWWAYLRRSEAYLKCCEQGGKGKLAKIYADFGDVREDNFKKWWTSKDQGAKLFGEQPRPLKRGIYADLLAARPEGLDAEGLKAALALHTRSTRYLSSVAAGQARHDLAGQAVEDMAPEHVLHALLEVHRRRQGRSQEDLRPKLRQRIIDECLVAYLQDTVDAWQLQSDGTYVRAQPKNHGKALSVQAALMGRYSKPAR